MNAITPEQRLIRWALRNRADWEILCGCTAAPLAGEDYARIAASLLREQLTEAHFILFYRCAAEQGLAVFPPGPA